MIEMRSGQSTEIHVMSGNEPTYIRLDVKGMESPVKLKLDYMNVNKKNEGDHLQMQDLHILLSYRYQKPSEKHFDRKYANRPKMLSIYAISDGGTGQKLSCFSNRFVFLNFMSETGCIFRASYISVKKEKFRSMVKIRRLKLASNQEQVAEPDLTVNDPFFDDVLRAQEARRQRFQSRSQLRSDAPFNKFNHPMMKFINEREVMWRKQ